MAYNYEYPYTDPHMYNDDWVLKTIRDYDTKFKETIDETTSLKEAAEEAKSKAEEAKDKAEEAQGKAEDSQTAAEEAQTAAEEAQSKSEDAAEDAQNIVSNTLNQISVLQARVDNIIPSGTQTEGNTELIDIRVGAYGDIYESAGSSVRTQVKYISEETRNLWKEGDVSFTRSKTVNLSTPIPAGTYILSAEILTDFTTSGNARVYMYKDVIAAASEVGRPYLPRDNGWNSTEVTLTDDCNILVFYPTPSPTGADDHNATWKDIQFVSGTKKTPYVPHITGVDYVLRADFEPIAAQYLSIEDLSDTTIDGESTIDIKIKPVNKHHPMTISIDAMYTRNDGVTDFPTFQSLITTDRNLVRQSTAYVIGEEGKYSIKQFRTIPYIWDDRVVTIRIKVPTGCQLKIKNIYNDFSKSVVRTDRGLQFNGRNGCCNVAPDESLHAFKMAYESGYNTCIVIPKVTSDGVWFAYHDDTFDINTTTLRTSTGQLITDTTYQGRYFNEIPWGYLEQFDSGWLFGAQFRGSKLLKLEDYFAFCAQTGIRPMFSMHPRIGVQTSTRLNELKSMLIKYNLLDKLIIKVPITYEDEAPTIPTLNNLRAIFNVFGNDIYKYEVDAKQNMEDLYEVIRLFNAFTDITVPKVIEWWVTQLLTDQVAGKALVDATLEAGYGVSCASIAHIGTDGASHLFTSGAEITLLQSWGVSEFTDDYNTSNGLFY